MNILEIGTKISISYVTTPTFRILMDVNIDYCFLKFAQWKALYKCKSIANDKHNDATNVIAIVSDIGDSNAKKWQMRAYAAITSVCSI